MDKKEIVEELRKVMKSSHRMRMKQIRKSSFFGGERGILMCIFDLIKDKKEVTPTLISERINVKRPTVTTALNSLEEKGYIQRNMDKKDRRKFFISLTDSGKKCVIEEKKRMNDELFYIVDNLGAEDSEKLLELSAKVIDILEKYYN